MSQFAILYCCGDERCHGRALPHIRKHFRVKGVFIVARPGGIKVLTDSNGSTVESIQGEVEDYCGLREIEVVAFAGHVGCARNFADREGQIDQLLACEELVQNWRLRGARTVRLYVDGETVEHNPQRAAVAEMPIACASAT